MPLKNNTAEVVTNSMTYRALILDTDADKLSAEVRSWYRFEEGDVLLDISHSSINYKDALGVTGQGKIIRGDFPFIPGIDLVGQVMESESDRFDVGDWVIGTGWGFGENHWGGYTEQLRTESKWLVTLPEDLDPDVSMVIGTAGFTSMLSVMALEDHEITPEKGEVLVTGASGGAGSIAVALLAKLGYEVVASTGSDDAHDYLHELGAARIEDRSAFDQGPERPLQSGKWAAAVDAVGGKTLATVLSQVQRHGAVAAFGNAGGASLETTVFPFILRGVNLLGIDSNTCPNDRRELAWRRLSELLSTEVLKTIHHSTVDLEQIPATCRKVLDGNIRGRVLVNVGA